jgi:hypothetical protein
LAIGIAGAVVFVIVAAVLIIGRKHSAAAADAVNAQADAYAAQLSISNLAMSESANLAGGKMTYLDGHVANHGSQTVTAITVQVLFRNGAHEVAQNTTMPLNLIRMREPYIDTESVAAAPIKPNGEMDFRLIFDAISPEWDGAYPELRVLRVTVR